MTMQLTPTSRTRPHRFVQMEGSPMHSGRFYRLLAFLAPTARSICVLLLLSIVPVVLYQVVDWKWLAIPWGVVFLLGTTVALSAGFKNVQTYNRASEAQQVWAAIASSSRTWGILCRNAVTDPGNARALMYRHFAWLSTLRYQMRESKPWEAADKSHNAESARLYSVHEREQTLASELARFVPLEESAQILAAHGKASQVLALQDGATRALLDAGTLPAHAFAELQKCLHDFQDEQGRSERIKNFPYPRQHAFVNSTLFVRILCVLLPLGMIHEFELLNASVDGWARGNMVWLGIPLSLLISWMYTSLDQVGTSAENPFESGANGVPIANSCDDIETDLRELLGETGVSAPSKPESDIT